MGVNKGLSVQFLSNAISMMYIEKELNFVQRKKVNSDELEQILSEMVENLRSKIEETHMEKIDTYLTLPGEKVRTYSLMKFPEFEGLKGSQLKQALELHLENELELKLEKPIYYYHTYESDTERLMTVSVVDEKEILLYPKMLFEKNFNLVKIQLESDSIRDYFLKNQIVDTLETTVYIHFFFDGEEKQVGFYIYKGDFLAAIRYLPMDYYDYSSLKNELEVVVKDCGEKIENFEVDSYCIVSEDVNDYDNLKRHFGNNEIVFINEKYPASKGLLNIIDLEGREENGETE